MKDVMKTVSKILFYALAVALFLWTCSLTVRLVGRLLPGDNITRFFALALFDFGALAWLLVFLANSAGLPQRAISLLAFVVDLLGVIFASIAELFLGGQGLAAIPAGLGTYVVWAVGIYTALNLTAVYAYHIADPEEMTEIRVRSMQDRVQDEALKQVEANVAEQAGMLAGEIAKRHMVDVLARLRLGPPVIDAVAKDVTTFEADTATSGSGVDPTQPQRSKK